MSDETTVEEGEQPGLNRRALVKRMAVGAFAVPAIISFQLDSLARAGTFKGKKQKHPKHDCPNQTEPNQTWPNQSDPNQTWPNQSDPNQTWPNQTHPNQKPPCDDKKKHKEKKRPKHKKKKPGSGSEPPSE